MGDNWLIEGSRKEGGVFKLMFADTILFWDGLAREEIGDSISLSEALSDCGWVAAAAAASWRRRRYLQGRLILGSGLEKARIYLTDLADLAFWVGNHRYTGFQGLYNACTVAVGRQGFLWRNELYELCKHRSLDKKFSIGK